MENYLKVARADDRAGPLRGDGWGGAPRTHVRGQRRAGETRRSVNNHWRAILLAVHDRDHVTRRTLAIRWGRAAGARAWRDVPIRGASAGIGPRRRSGRRGDATTARADVPVR